MATKEKMDSDKNTPRLIGAAFLLQAIASAVAGLILLRPLIVSGNIVDTMTNMSNNALRVRAGIVVEMITVMALVILSVLLYVTLKKQNRNIAFVALGLRLTEVALLAVSRIATFALLRTSQASVIEGHPAYLQTLGNLAYENQEFAYAVNMVRKQAISTTNARLSMIVGYCILPGFVKSHPFTTAIGLVRATFREIPAPWATLTTSFTSLYASGASSASPDMLPALTSIPRRES